MQVFRNFFRLLEILFYIDLFCILKFYAQKNHHWKSLVNKLETMEAIGNKITLTCDNHRKIFDVSRANEFFNCSNGGCWDKCDILMGCGERCKNFCHNIDLTHENSRSINYHTKNCDGKRFFPPGVRFTVNDFFV
jgi:hypothetical protein